MKNKNNTSFFVSFANCLPVKGAARSLICDVQTGGYYYIPNDLYDVLQMTKEMRIAELFASLGEANEEVLNEYLAFLLENNLGFVDDEPESFPPMSMEWDVPSTVTNSIIDIDEEYFHTINYKRIFAELSECNCHCVQIRSFGTIGMEILEGLLNYTIDSRIKEVRLVLKYNAAAEAFVCDNLLYHHNRIGQVIFFNAPENNYEEKLGARMIYLEKPDLSDKDCGQICKSTFSINIAQFTEALHFNSCLNRKISVDARGNIKNCPSQLNNFGNVNEKTLKEVVRDQQFQEKWKIRKDDIRICRDCEHRYICTDCRVFTQDPNDPIAKPSKCTYDPYTAT